MCDCHEEVPSQYCTWTIRSRIFGVYCIYISAPLPPDLVETNANSSTNTSILLEWIGPSGLYQSVNVYINNSLRNELSSLVNSTNSTRVEGLDPNTAYVVTMTAVSKLGVESARSTEMTFYTSKWPNMIHYNRWFCDVGLPDYSLFHRTYTCYKC